MEGREESLGGWQKGESRREVQIEKVRDNRSADGKTGGRRDEGSDQRVRIYLKKEQKGKGRNNQRAMMMMKREMKDNVSTSAVASNARNMNIGLKQVKNHSAASMNCFRA